MRLVAVAPIDFHLAVKVPELMRLVLQASVAALVNVQSLEVVDAQMKLRAVVGNCLIF